MACTNGTKTYVNIKELPEISDINNGDFLIHGHIHSPNGGKSNYYKHNKYCHS